MDPVPARRNWLARLLRREARNEQMADMANSLYFLHAATVGLNVEFARLATARSRRAALGGLTYPASSFEALLHLRPIAVNVQLSGVVVRSGSAGPTAAESEAGLLLAGDVLQLAVVNTPVFGGVLNLRLPGVDARDHVLDVVLVEPPRLNNVSQIVEKLRLPLRPARNRPSPADQEREAGRLSASSPYVDVLFPGVRRYQARAISIATVEPADVTLDGEVRARTPITIRVAPAAVTILLPLARASALAGDNTETPSASPAETPS